MLDALIAEALANNLNVKVAAANVEQAAGVLTQTRSALFPQVGYDAHRRRARARPNPASSPEVARLIPNPQTSYQALLQASWEIDLWGRIRRLSESARANLLATDEARRGVILSLVASVAGNYLTLRGLDAQLVIAKQTLGTYAESVKLFTLQFQYGQVSQMNVAQVAVAVRDRRRADSADRVADRADRERAVGAARPQSRARSRAASRSTS